MLLKITSPVSSAIDQSTAFKLFLKFTQSFLEGFPTFICCAQKLHVIIEGLIQNALSLRLESGPQDAGCHLEKQDQKQAYEEQEEHAAALLHGATAAQEAQNHDDGAHRDQDVHSHVGVSVRVPRGEDLLTIFADSYPDCYCQDQDTTQPEQEVEDKHRIFYAATHTCHVGSGSGSRCCEFSCTGLSGNVLRSNLSAEISVPAGPPAAALLQLGFWMPILSDRKFTMSSGPSSVAVDGTVCFWR